MWAISLHGFLVMTSYSKGLNHTQTCIPTWPGIGHYMIKMRQLLSARLLEEIFSWSGNETLNDVEVHKNGNTPVIGGSWGMTPQSLHVHLLRFWCYLWAIAQQFATKTLADL